MADTAQKTPAELAKEQIAKDTEANKIGGKDGTTLPGTEKKTGTSAEETVNDTIGASLIKHDPDGFNTSLKDLKSEAQFEKRGKERGLINEKTGASVTVRDNGQINLSGGKYAQYKISVSGKSIEQTLESNTITNRKRLTTDEIVVNEHKINPMLWELTDFKKINLPTNDATIVGNLCMGGSVLTKSWDFNLKRYVLIRRPWRGPVFSPLLNVPTIKSAMHVYDPLQVDDDILANSDKGYHVNSLIMDAKSLVGKDGVDRPGIDRKFMKTFGNASDTGGVSPTGAKLGGGNVQPKVVYEYLQKQGYKDVVIAGIMGNIQQESSFNSGVPNAEGSGAYGLFQWLGSRRNALEKFASDTGRTMDDAGAQLDFLMKELSTGYPKLMPNTWNDDSVHTASASAAADFFEEEFERGGDSQKGSRNEYAENFYQKIQNHSL